MTDAVHKENREKLAADRKAVAAKAVAEGVERQAQAVKDFDEHTAGAKPTPTQEECDKARMGEHVMEKEDDGSGPDRGPGIHRTSVAGPGGSSYKTRDATASSARATTLTAPAPAPAPTHATATKAEDKK